MTAAVSNLPKDPLPLDPGPERVLVVEDEPRLTSLLADYLRAAGHHPECVSDGAAVLTAWRERQHDLVLLDLMLPGVDGLSVCRQLRAVSRVPIVMLTARADEADRLLGLELGADDYIPKNPFSPRGVVARVKAVLRRARDAGRRGIRGRPQRARSKLGPGRRGRRLARALARPAHQPDAHRIPPAQGPVGAIRPRLRARYCSTCCMTTVAPLPSAPSTAT